MSTIGKSDVVTWLRKQAAKHRLAALKYDAAADEAECAEAGIASDESVADTAEALTVERVADYLDYSAKRKPEIAHFFGVTEDVLDELMTAENGFHRGLQGWWTYRKPNDNGPVQD